MGGGGFDLLVATYNGVLLLLLEVLLTNSIDEALPPGIFLDRQLLLVFTDHHLDLLPLKHQLQQLLLLLGIGRDAGLLGRTRLRTAVLRRSRLFWAALTFGDLLLPV